MAHVKKTQAPNEYCSHCKRATQRRDNAPNCYWCAQPFGSRPSESSVPSTFEEWWENVRYEAYWWSNEQLARKAWNAAKEAS